jgi:hypothetical protein
MDATPGESPIERDGHGRFAPGQSGNPAGRKPGTPNRATRLRDQLREGELEQAIRGLMELVRDGNGVAIRFVLERMFPKPREREIDLGPALGEHATPAEMVERIVRKMIAGDITIDEATRMALVVDKLRHALEATAATSEATAAPAPAAGSPAFDLQTAGEGSDAPAAPTVPPRPLNRHERRRAAALERGTRSSTPLRAAA